MQTFSTILLNSMLYEVYEMLTTGHLDVYYFHKYISSQLADKLFLIFQSKLQKAGKNVEAMPLRPEKVYEVENEMKAQHVTSSIYPYEICFWMLYHTLMVSTTYFRTLQQRITDYQQNY